MLWTIIVAIIVGAIIGALARLVLPGRQSISMVVTIILGILGSVVATWVGQAVGFYPPGSGAGFIASVIGAIVLLWIYGMIRKKA